MAILVCVALGLLVAVMAYIISLRFQAEAESLNEVMELKDREKYYVKLALEHHRIENTELVKEDEELLNDLVERDWLLSLKGGAMIRGGAAEYLARRLKPSSLDR